MKTIFRLNGRKITRKAVIEMTGREYFDRLMKTAGETFREDPEISNDFSLGSKGMLNIEFQI